MSKPPIHASSPYGIVYKDGSALAPNNKFYTREEMEGFLSEYRGVNRIKKPMFILFYTDNKPRKQS
jgi:hypothetical protein